MNNNLRIGFIGLGLMGSPMAKNILRKGFPLTVYNRTISKTKELKKLGATVANTPSELAATSDVIITMVTGPQDVEQVIFDKNGVVEGLKITKSGKKENNPIVIDMSTIGPKAAVKIFSQLGNRGVDFLDAPVTGSTPKAKTGELTVFIGGKKQVFEKVKPILLSMGTSLFFMGPSGSGQAIKLVNNLIVAETMAALSEGMLLAENLGLSKKKAAEVLENVPALSPFMRLKLPFLVKGKYPVLFSVANMEKDLGLARFEAAQFKSGLPLLKLVHGLYKEAKDSDLSGKDIASIFEILKR